MDGEELFYENDGVVSSSPSKNYKYKPNQPKTQTGRDIIGNTALASGKVTKNAGRAVNATGKVMQAAGTAAQVAGKGMQAVGKGANAAGDGLMHAGAALSSSGVGAIAGAPLTALGALSKGAGTATSLAGKGVDAAGKTTKKAGKEVSKTGKKVTDTGKNMENKAKNIKKSKDDSETIKSAAKKGYKNVKESLSELKNNLTPGGVVKNTTKKIGTGLKSIASGLKDAASGDFEAILQGASKILKSVFIKILLKLLLAVTLLAILIYMIFSPLIEAIKTIDAALTNVANFEERLSNFYSGFGFQNSKDAFYDELKDLQNKYDYKLDVELLMSTIFYTEMYEGYDTEYGNVEAAGVVDPTTSGSANQVVDEDTDYTSLSGQDSATSFEMVRAFLKQKVKEKVDEANSTIDENGLTYTIGKIYRLRKLARNQFSTNEFGGQLRTGELQTITLNSFIGIFANDFKNYILALIGAILAPTNDMKNAVISALAGGSYTEELLNDIVEAYERLGLSVLDLFNDIFIGFQSIEKVSFHPENFDINHPLKSIGDIVTIDIRSYQFDEENYTNYLENYYIPHMPEFRKYVYDSNGQLNTKEVKRIRQDIYDSKEMYTEIFGEMTHVEVVESYNESCLGAVNRDVVQLLSLPVDIDSSNCINFSNSYGFGITTSGDHKGIDFNSTTTHNSEGDNVYSISSGGKVLESSADGTYTGSDCKGGCLKIEYNLTNNDNTYQFIGYYEGMSLDSVTLLKDQTVGKGDLIGKIGSAAESEDGTIASLHFGYMDLTSNTFIDPTNIIIQCESILSQNPNATIVEIPQNFDQAYTVTCYGPGGWHLGCRLDNVRAISSSSNQRKVHDQWVSAGAKFKNGIAVLNLDGVDRYLVATASKLGIVGDSVNYELEDGFILPAVIADQKSAGDANYTEYGHRISANSNTISVLEFEVDTQTFNAKGNPSTSSWGLEWDSSKKVTKAAINGSILDGTASNLSLSENTSNNGLRSCSTTTNSSVETSTSAITLHSSVTRGEYESRKVQIMPDGVKSTSSEQQSSYIISITVPIWDGSSESTMTLNVNKNLESNYQAVFRELTDMKFPIIRAQTAAYNYRAVQSSGRLSDHAFGSAIDVNWEHNPQYKVPDNSQYAITEEVVAAFAKQGFYWGGDWSNGSQDPMHFSWTGM